MPAWKPLTVKLTKAAEKELGALESGKRKDIAEAIAAYQKSGTGSVKRLQGRGGFRLRVGNYRVLFTLTGSDPATMTVTRIADRKEVY